MRVADPDSLSTISSILDGKHDEGVQTALTSIIQSICLQVKQYSGLVLPAYPQAWHTV